jgi:UbiD family decarboxylase
MWKIFKGYEEKNEECPVATVLGHHPAFYLGACYKGPFEMDEYEIIGGYLQEPLRLVPSETYGENFLVPADAEIIIEGALLPGKRLEEGPFGDTLGYVGPKKYQNSLWYEVRAITHRKNAIYESLLTPDEDKPWLDLAQEAAYFKRIKEVVPTVIAVCKGGRYAHYNVFISIKKMNEGDPGRAAAAALSFTHTKNVFVFDEDIDIFNPTEILWALATRVQPHKNIQIIKPLMRGDALDPSLGEEKVTSVMIVDATKPLNQAYPLLSKCPDKVKTRINLEDYIPREVLNSIPVDRTSYWG